MPRKAPVAPPPENSVRQVAEKLVEIFAAAHGRPPADIGELDAFGACQATGTH
jgi:hypothetical protein